MAEINAFARFGREVYVAHIVASCTSEYDALDQPLEIGRAVSVCALAPDDVLRRIRAAGPRMRAVGDLVAEQVTLRGMLTSPLLLSLLTVSAAGPGGPDDGVSIPADQEAGYPEIFARYVAERLNHLQGTRSRRSGTTDQRASTARWLRVLAARLTAREQTVFILGRLNGEWLTSSVERSLTAILPALLFGVTLSPLGLVISGPRGALQAFGLAAVGAVATTQFRPDGGPASWSRFSLAGRASLLGAGLRTAVLVALCFGVVDFLFAGSGETNQTVSAADYGTRAAERLTGIFLTYVLLAGFVAASRPRVTRVSDSQRGAVIWSLALGVAVAVSMGVTRVLGGDAPDAGHIAVNWGVRAGIGAWLIGMSRPVDRISWSWSRAVENAFRSFTLSLVIGAGVLFGFVISAGLAGALVAATVTVVAVNIGALVLHGVDPVSIPIYTGPNQAVGLSARAGALVGACPS